MEEQTSMPTGSGDVDANVQTMTSAQRLRFKQAVVTQAIHFVSKLLPPEAEDEGHRCGIRAAIRWLRETSDGVAEDVTCLVVAECWDGGVRYHDYPSSVIRPVQLRQLRSRRRGIYRLRPSRRESVTAPGQQECTRHDDTDALRTL